MKKRDEYYKVKKEEAIRLFQQHILSHNKIAKMLEVSRAAIGEWYKEIKKYGNKNS